ncbi:unnamed protein product [Thelazia callipaeda]|uniref:Serine-type D-Ala-D-Ala carboxypeptidase n=1 Tax=Thelazia callipaeda TaxID=103827 RepID=A0A0N5D7Q8_THECL|nr:unnamed protein product [Thelazia callipaeda]
MVDPLSRRLNIRYPKVAMIKECTLRIICCLWMISLQSMPKEVKRLLAVVKLEVNSAKSATITQRLAERALNGKNFIKAMNEHAISIINYYAGVLKLEPENFKAIDHDIRQLLIKYGIHKQSACSERLHLRRNELRRGLHNVE